MLVRLRDQGDAVVVIEHQPDLLAACDRLVELGPAGGAAGGRVIAEGSPAELAADSNEALHFFQEASRLYLQTHGGDAERGKKATRKGKRRVAS